VTSYEDPNQHHHAIHANLLCEGPNEYHRAARKVSSPAVIHFDVEDPNT